MEHSFDKDYWDEHWQESHDPTSARREAPPNPHLVREIGGLVPGTALDAGCGEGAEAIWLAKAGWRVTAADIAAGALARAAERAANRDVSAGLQWIEADLSTWKPDETFDLVTTHYAHPAMPQLAFYDRIAGWVAPGGCLLIVGHRHTHDTSTHAHHPPAESSVTAADITARLDPATWDIVTAEEPTRTVTGPDGGAVTLDDVVVRAIRRS